MDVLIPLKNSDSWGDNNELRYCLRSLEKYFLDLGSVYLVGHRPKWVKNVKHVYCPDYPTNNKGYNIITKILWAISATNISSSFVFCSDDQCFLKPMITEGIKPYYVYDLKGFKFKGGNKIWMKCLKNTKKILEGQKLNCYNFESHTPKIIDGSAFKLIMRLYDWRIIMYPTHSLYFNNVVKNPQQMPDNYRAFFDKENMDVNLIEGKSFLGYSDLGLSWQLQHKLAQLFPDKSRFEI